ncbi:2-amino-4-hydroxy-6-hydroxymethyldihydropteridine diphosphokinase [Niabella terrae]
MNTVYLMLGGNLGNRLQNINQALEYITEKVATPFASSSIYETEPWGMANQPAFYNQVVALKTLLEPEDLLAILLEIEARMGRVRLVKYGSRIIDIDILLYNDLVCQTDSLTLPHPRMQERRFVLEPLAELAPGLEHPTLHRSISALLADCADPLTVRQLPGTATDLVANGR